MCAVDAKILAFNITHQRVGRRRVLVNLIFFKVGHLESVCIVAHLGNSPFGSCQRPCIAIIDKACLDTRSDHTLIGLTVDGIGIGGTPPAHIILNLVSAVILEDENESAG